jgi:hypothetical protein
VKYLLSILTLFAVTLTSGAVNADEKEDREAIRALFHQEQEGHRLGNEQMVRSAHWDDFYIIRTPRINGVSRYMLSGINLGEDYLGGYKFEPRVEEEGRGVTSEVNHIAVKGDVALAVTQFHYWGPWNGRINNGGHQTMWVAERRDGTWKWKSAIVGFENFQQSSPAPQPAEEAE